MPSNSVAQTSNSTNRASTSGSQSNSVSQSSSNSMSSSSYCDWAKKTPELWLFKHPTSKVVLFEVTLTYEQWTCKPVKYRKIVWAVTKRAATTDAIWNGTHESTAKFKIGNLDLVTDNTQDVPGVPPSLPGVKMEWFDKSGNNYLEPKKISYDAEVDSFSIVCTAYITVITPVSSEEWNLDFDPKKQK